MPEMPLQVYVSSSLFFANLRTHLSCHILRRKEKALHRAGTVCD